MSLQIFRDIKDIQCPFERSNDLYFRSAFLYRDDFICEILDTVDQCDYVSDSVVFSRRLNCQIPIGLLSTGCKTLLNIYMHSNICFSVEECGMNAIMMLRKFRDGKVYYKFPVFAVEDLEKDNQCDILFEGNHFIKLTDLMQFCNDLDWSEYDGL